jgi:hypothetical protein
MFSNLEDAPFPDKFIMFYIQYCYLPLPPPLGNLQYISQGTAESHVTLDIHITTHFTLRTSFSSPFSCFLGFKTFYVHWHSTYRQHC